VKLHRVTLSESARHDLESLSSYVSTHASPDVAADVLEAIEHAVLGLCVFPNRYPHACESTKLRQVICKNYRILFRVSLTTVTVLAIVHTAKRTR
jgi:plasmid stabilization system protein ParE